MSAKRKRKKRTLNYAADARLLGVSRQHLRAVLLLERESHSLLQRWLGLDQQRRAQQKTITQSNP
jgi:hypothetical protein